MNLHVRNDSPLELPPECRGAMEEQARQMFLEEEREDREDMRGKASQTPQGTEPFKQPRRVGDSPKSGPSPEIPLPGKAVAGGSIPQEFPY